MTHAFPLSADVASLPALERLVGEVNDLQSKLILLVGCDGKTRLLRALAQRLNTACSAPLRSRVTSTGRSPIRTDTKAFGSGSCDSWARYTHDSPPKTFTISSAKTSGSV